MKKAISLSIICLLSALVLFKSFYFEKLDVREEREKVKNFDPCEKVDYFWNHDRNEILESAIDLKAFDSLLAENPEKLIKQYGKSFGITSTFCFLVKGEARMVLSEAATLPVNVPDGQAEYHLKIKTIFGNTARDALGVFDVDDFENTMDFNGVATELNQRIEALEISKLDSVSVGETIAFIGGIAVNSESIQKEMKIIPIKIVSVQ